MKIEFLFPELVTLYGEKANVEYLAKCLPDAEVVTTSLSEGPAFAIRQEDKASSITIPDFVYIGSMEEDFFEAAIAALKPYKKALEKYIKSGRIFLATGNAIDIFGKTIEWKDRVYPDGHISDCTIEGLGLFELKSVVRRDYSRHNSWYYGEYEGIKVLGHRSTFSRQYGAEKDPFIKTLGGFGMNDETKQEGVHRDGFYGTTLLGPLLIMNPPLTKYLIGKMLGRDEKKTRFADQKPITLFEEKWAMEAYENRLSYLSKPGARYEMGALG
ncbi:MAG: hypothetical protein IIY45_05570 [Firmicutes bacterium]|nr:hypothetical protein [Bacillota bacterium]